MQMQRNKEGGLFVSRDFIKHRPHIHYLMRYCGPNSAEAIATYNSKKKTITLREEAFNLCPIAEDFVRLSLEEEKKSIKHICSVTMLECTRCNPGACSNRKEKL